MTTCLENPERPVAQHDLQTLETQIDALLQAYQRLREENTVLRQERAALLDERDALREKTELARERIQVMLERLKELEAESP